MKDKMLDNAPQKGWVDIGPDVIDGVYSNMMAMAYSPMEFVVDFFSIMPGMPSPHLRQRIIMSPVLAKLFYMQLRTEIERFESGNGTIPVHDSNEMPDENNQEIKA